MQGKSLTFSNDVAKDATPNCFARFIITSRGVASGYGAIKQMLLHLASETLAFNFDTGRAYAERGERQKEQPPTDDSTLHELPHIRATSESAIT